MIDLSRHPWLSGLLGDQEISNILSPEAELQRYLTVEAAWTRALGKVDNAAIANELADAIETSNIEMDLLKDGFAKDGVPIPALVAALREKVPNDQAALIHTGLTSQDVVDTATMLALKGVCEVLERRLLQLVEEIATLAARFASNALTAFTRMQPALETTVAQHLEQWRRPLNALLSDLPDVAAGISVIQWGGPIGARNHPDATTLAEAFSQNLNLGDPGFAWHTDRTRILNFGHFLSRVSICTGKIGEDIALWASTGLGQISLAGGTSSAMPHKNNPISAEALISLSEHVAVLLPGLAQSARHEGHRSGRAWTSEWIVLPQMCVAASDGINLACTALEGINLLGQEK